MARQVLLKDKNALEEQEEQLGKRKEQLDLQMEIAASVAKVNILKTFEGSRVSRTKCDGMNSYLEREQRKSVMLNIAAEAFVPVAGQPSQCTSEGVHLHSHLLDVQPKERDVGAQQHVTSSETKVQRHKMHSERVFNRLRSCIEDPATVAQNEGNHERLVTVLKRQNEITSLLVEQQSLLLLPKRDIQIFDGDPLQFQAFMMAFEHSIEEKT